MSRQYKYIGKSLLREDVKDKIAGQAKYVEDMRRPNMLIGKLYTSQKTHAIVTIDKTDAMKIPGVVDVLTYEDVPQNPYNSNQWFPGAKTEEDEYILHQEARHVGDRIALIIAENQEAADKGYQALTVHYHEKPVVIGIENSKENQILVNGKNNLIFEKTLQCGDVSSAFEKTNLIVETKGTTPKIHHSAIENHSCLTEIDAFGNLIVWSPCQVVFQVQHIVAKAIGWPYDKIRVVKTIIGGSFGGKGIPVLEPLCAYATIKTGRPVQIVMDRKDSIASTRMRNATHQVIKTAVNNEGKIVARDIIAEFDGGSYITNGAAIAMAFGKKAFRLYKIDNQRYTGKTYFTHTTPGGACRGYGSPQLHAISEINIDQIADSLGMDPVEFRLLNAVDPKPFELGSKDDIGMPGIGNARLKDCLIKGREAFGWDRKRKIAKEKNTERYAYGVGVAAGVHGNGYHGGFPDFTNVTVQVMPDNRVSIKIGIHDLGCGTVMTMQQIAAEVLDLDPQSIHVPEADTFISPYDSAGTQASRVTFVNGGAVKEACEILVSKMKESYCLINDCDNEEVSISQGVISKQGYPSMAIGDLAVETELKLEKNLKIDLEYQSKGNPAVYAVTFTSVQVDKYTGLVEVLDMLCVQDVGQTINQTLAEGQVQGGAQMSIGMALCEEVIYDDKGNLKTENFSKYHLINAPSMPKIETLFIEEGEPLGPFGAKSVGEIAAVTPAPAIMNAINHALGTSITDYPATPERIIAAIVALDANN